MSIDRRIESGFYIPLGKSEQIYRISDDLGGTLGYVWRTYRVKQTIQFQMYLSIDYELQINPMRKLKENELRMLRIYFDNLVRTLTDDMQTIYSNKIEERMHLPFYQNIMHIEVI